MAELTVVSARRRRGIVRGRLTRIGKDIAVLEGQEELTFDDRRMVERLLEQLKDNDSTFEQRHVEVLNFIEEEDQEALNQEEAVFDEHVDRVAELTRRIERLRIPQKEAHVSSPITTTAPNPSVTLVKRLKYIEQQRDVIARSLRSPLPGTEEHPKPWLQKCQKDIDALSAQLTGVLGDILALPGEDTALLNNATSIQGALSELDYETVRRLHLLEDTRTSHFEPTVELPKISIPTFDGDVLNWAVFWEQFELSLIHI